MEYFVLRPDDDEENVYIDSLPEGAPADWQFDEGIALGNEFPADATMRYSDNFPGGRKLLDFVNNISDVLIISAAARTIFDSLGIDHVEYLPVKILDHRGNVAGPEYFIANVLGSEPIIDMDKSDLEMSELDEDEISMMNNLVVDHDAIDEGTKLCRASAQKTWFFVSKDVCDAMHAGGLTGFKVFPAEGWDGLDI